MGQSVTTGNTSNGTIQSSAVVTAFSPFTLASGNSLNPLPIELVSFTAVPNYEERVVTIKWVTQSEHNNDFFTVEKTIDGEQFEEVARVKGNGNSSEINKYNCIDSQPYEGISYYRLKQTDLNGEFHYSPLVAVEFGNKTYTLVHLLPNPARGENVQLRFIYWNDEESLIELYDPQGRILLSKHFLISRDTSSSIYLPTSTLAQGVYLLRVSNRSKSLNYKLVLE